MKVLDSAIPDWEYLLDGCAVKIVGVTEAWAALNPNDNGLFEWNVVTGSSAEVISFGSEPTEEAARTCAEQALLNYIQSSQAPSWVNTLSGPAEFKTELYTALVSTSTDTSGMFHWSIRWNKTGGYIVDGSAPTVEAAKNSALASLRQLIRESNLPPLVLSTIDSCTWVSAETFAHPCGNFGIRVDDVDGNTFWFEKDSGMDLQCEIDRHTNPVCAFCCESAFCKAEPLSDIAWKQVESAYTDFCKARLS